MYSISRSNNKEKTIKNIILSLFMYSLLLENIFEKYIPIIGSLDGLVGCCIIILGFIKIFEGANFASKYKNSYKILVYLIILVIIGLAGNLIYNYQNIRFALKDTFTLKGLFVYAMLPVVFYDFKLQDYREVINQNLKFISVVLFAFTIINLFTDIFPYYEIRFGIKSHQLMFSHPTYLASAGILIICMLSAFINYYNNNYIYIGMMYSVVLLTLRTKAIIFLIGYLYLLFVVCIKNRKFNKKDFLIVGTLVLLLSIGQITEYLQNTDWARSSIVINSFDIAKSHFPFGSGFGTFGSWISGMNYSPLYFTYDMQSIWGVSPDQYNFVSDNFWPMIIAQFGFVGLMILLYIIYLIYRNIESNNNLYLYLGQMSVLIYLMSASIGESSFAGEYSVIAFIIIGLLTEYNRRRISYVKF